MKVSIARKGGWAAQFNRRSPPAVLDAGTLSQPERAELDRLVLAAFAHSEAVAGADRKAAGSYTITVKDGPSLQTLDVADVDEARAPAAADLCAWVEARLRRP